MWIDSHQVCKLSVKMLTRIMISWNVVCLRAWHAFAFEHILHDFAKHSCFSQRVGSAINMVCRIAHYYGMKKGSSKSSAKVQLLRAKSIIISLCQRSPTINQSSRDNKNSFHSILVRLFFFTVMHALLFVVVCAHCAYLCLCNTMKLRQTVFIFTLALISESAFTFTLALALHLHGK